MTTDFRPDLRDEEYRALRATIRERGTARLWIAVVTLIAWAALVLASSAFFDAPITGLVPLIVLATGFEAVFALHAGVERIGRYLQVFYETDPQQTPRWEHAAMALGARPGALVRLPDPLFIRCFGSAGLFNVIPIALASVDTPPSWLGLPVEPVVFGLLHVAFLFRLAQARRLSATQRARELEAFQGDRPH